MGVFGLLTHCLNNREQCVEFVDIVAAAASDKDGIEILCDFYCVEHLFLSSFWKSLWRVSRNPYLELLGGEYASFGEYVSKLIDDLKSLNIKLVMFVDGAKESPESEKWETWKTRHFRDLRKMRERLNLLHKPSRLEEPVEESLRPVLLEVQLFETVKRCGCEVIHCTDLEADYVIVRNLNSRPNAFAILSNDSDFCVFTNSRFIPFDLFDINGDLGLGAEQRLTTKPETLRVGVISSAKVWMSLGLSSQNQMIDLCIIKGNDFSTSYMKRLGDRIGLGRQSKLMDAVQWIKEHTNVENNATIADELRRDRKFKKAIDHARLFYRLQLPANQEASHHYLAKFITDGVEQGQLPSSILSMHFGFYWHRMLIEDEGRHGPTIAEVALQPLRSYIYRMVLPQTENTVTEYGRMDRDFTSNRVYASREKFLPPVNNIPKDKISANLTLFHKIMSHQENGYQQTEWHKRYGWRDGFKCYILRYFLLLNFQQNLKLTLKEFLPLAALVFCQVETETYQGVCIPPDSRSVTIGNWFQDLYRHAFYFLGKILNISEQFPHPCSIFSGAIWTAFYMLSVRDIRFIGEENMQRIRKDMDHIIKEKRHIIHNLVEGIFDFNPRF